jgi:hypothetical protein
MCSGKTTSSFLRGDVSYGEAWWFCRDDGEASLDEALTALRDAGLIAGNPATGIPEIIDDDGRQAPWDGAEVRRRWMGGETVTLQFWVNRETDVLVELMRPHRLLTFDLDGMTAAEARRAVFAVLNAALSLPATQAVVVDRNLPDCGDDLLVATTGGSSFVGLSFTADLLLSVQGDGHHRLDIREGSWLSKPAAIVQSFR